jgi:hypothetical protein
MESGGVSLVMRSRCDWMGCHILIRCLPKRFRSSHLRSLRMHRVDEEKSVDLQIKAIKIILCICHALRCYYALG